MARQRRPVDLTQHNSPIGTDKQPISHLQWVDPEDLHANDYNPNRVPPTEMKLLRISILEDGWTQPIVGQESTSEIIDGFHRWTLGLRDDAIRAMTGGLVPIVTCDSDPSEQRMSTIRHNRARGTHHVVRMADIVTALLESKLPAEDIMLRLGMEREEVERLLDRGRHSQHSDKFTQAWKPKR